MKRTAHASVLLICLGVMTAAYGQLRDSGQGKAATKKGPKTTIVVRPGPPVKPTQTARPNTNQKSDWNGQSQAQR